MKSIRAKITAAALAVSVGLGMGIAPSFASDAAARVGPTNNFRYDGHHYRSHHNWRHHQHRRHNHRYYRRHHDNGAGVVGGLITGAIIGGIAANALGNRGGSAHVNWCYDRYRSYRASDNTFQPYHGPRRQCVSPY